MDWRIPALGALAVAVYSLRPTAKHPPYPPGPPGEVFIGNLRSMPLKDEEVYFTELGKEYGDIIHMDLLGRHLVVLNSLSTAVDLMDKRSAIYSGRPRLPLTEILGVDKTLVFSSIGTNLFRLHRRLIQRYLMKETVVTHDYRSSWIRASRALARRLLEKPEEWEQSMVHFSTAVTIEVTVGHQITSEDDKYNQLAKNICDYAIPTLKPPEGSLVDLFPFLKYLPGWIPGNYWVGKARFARQFVQEFRNYPVEDTMQRMAKGSARPSFLVKQLEDMQNGTADPNMDMEDIKGLIVTMFSGGAETTSSSLSIFLAALFLHPECQRKAQEEIDRVVGRSRLPDFSDRETLPYVTGLMHEASRWRPVLPLGVPRTTMADDVYNGMFIPKDTIVMANVKAMGLDEKVYKDPETFDPSRYMPEPEGRGEPPLSSAFGFGRRICPGRFLADDTLWIAVATLLATMSVSKPVDVDGKEYMPDIKWAPGITSHPLPFPCRIQGRTPEIKRLLSLD